MAIDQKDYTDDPIAHKVGFVAARKEPYRDSRGKYRTKSLFKEWELDEYPAYYTLGPVDVDGYISLRSRYLGLRDPTEYKFAQTYLDGWDHFQLMMTSCQWFRELVNEWRTELAVLMTSEAIERIREIPDQPRVSAPTKFAALRYLAERGWTDTDKKTKRGRPSKEEVQGELKKQARAQGLLEDDAKRIGIN